MRTGLALVGLITGLALAAPAGAQVTPDGKNRKVRVENGGSVTISNLYASPVTSKTWEEDLLGQGVIPAGQSRLANIDNGTAECSYDLKAVLVGGRQVVRRTVNVCAVTKWVIRDSGDSIE